MTLGMPSFLAQLALLAALVVLLHVRVRGRWVRPPVREVASAVLVWCVAFTVISGGRGCAPALDDPADLPRRDAPADPFHRS